LQKYAAEQRIRKACEPRDLINRFLDICQFNGITHRFLTTELLDLSWNNYFGMAHE
jgi:CRISPR/Cas system-associated endonuclease Cas1